jgi:hypothetical protein
MPDNIAATVVAACPQQLNQPGWTIAVDRPAPFLTNRVPETNFPLKNLD